MQIKSDLEIIKDLLNEYVRPNSTRERKLLILTDLEYLVHQVGKSLYATDFSVASSIVVYATTCFNVD